MPLISLQDLTMAFAGPPLLDHLQCQIEVGDRIGLLGRNGAGKSTLLKLIAGTIVSDFGNVTSAPGTRISILGQDVPQDLRGNISEVVRAGHVIDDHHTDDWQAQTDVDQILSRMELDPSARFETLSSGMKRRVLLAKALVSRPDFLLLDEPTNHLDLEAILWLEKFLSQHQLSFMFVTHDRMFLRRMANRILELDRGRLFDWACDYDQFLVRKEQVLAAEEKEQELFDKKLAAEEVWIRKGIKARRTRNEGRVRALESMRRERSQRREKLGTARLQIQEGQKSGALVIGLDEVSFDYAGKKIIDRFSTGVMRGDRIGIIGPNGAGKSTLLKIMLGRLQPTSGRVKLGTSLQIAYFDQLREQLDLEQTVQENVADGYDTVQLASGKKHVLGYLQDFLFSPDRARTQVKFLSGGERNRLLLARLFAKPANLIVLDEPTNDLDAETLEMLEEHIVQFTGTVITVSHDRTFLNNVATSIISFEAGGVNEYIGGYDDWQRQFEQRAMRTTSVAKEIDRKKETSRQVRSNPAATLTAGRPRKLKFNEKLELEQLPSQIERIESELNELNQFLASPDFYRQSKQEIIQWQEKIKLKEAELAASYLRWEELENLTQAEPG
jgi:ATP-binding cassette subfamily F protein uup